MSNQEQLLIVTYGTYCFIQKSANNYFQRVSYSSQKRQHLVKPFVVTSLNGRIIDIFGINEAIKNDAKILLDIMQDKNGLSSILREGDVILLDRGLRDAIEQLENVYKLKPQMPCLLKKSQKQLTSFEANTSRLVTKCRWVIEVTNSFLKQSFRALKSVRNKTLPHILSDYRIAAALIN